ncbi:MAG: putative L-lactate dehydrogenase operon regulatory protein [Alphaproteobacteria bacterium MarineAlpha3_Bin2]|jgi:GntR family transcriptional repressor for pyruvate dehydrogenase complex|nr:MAG: putative L-lactate dehydrogenase operon regulatory protein [Alphaproteobacteria bacterium MarineAlpha3_Bin2]
MAKPSSPTPSSDAFTPIRNVRLYETIIEQIAALVEDGQLHSGDRFPTERQLQEKWRVSRPVLREAFRALEMQGIVESRPGGGRYLRAERIPHPDEFRSLRLSSDRETLLQIWQARETVEVKAAGLAAANASRAQLAAIGRPLRMLETMTPDAYRRGDVNHDFHTAVARASGNPVLEQVILDLLGRFNEAGFKDLPPAKDWDGLQADHQPIYDAIASGDPKAAANAMTNHFKTLHETLED